jgi:hypothetical protein
MVKGLDLFREHFRDYADRYVLIGGTACDLILNDIGVQFRATKDLDIVLCVEALDAEFANAFWDFVKSGEYTIQERGDGEKRFYRFQKPLVEGYPAMLELFSRIPDALTVVEGSHLTPIPVDEEVSSLSAILLDEVYYGWIHRGRRVIEGVPVVGPEYLVPLKAKAWLDLSARSQDGEKIRSGEFKKHKNDVYRLHQVIPPDTRLNPHDDIVRDMSDFLDQMATEEVDLKNLNIMSRSRDEILADYRRIYGV